ncbi:MAG TPA: zf-HC2 domain-containing protein [Longimicrobiales bacterium]|nr:zf-HC2 domain-containing protein [Longimicrobiales bacterium]
MNTHPVELISAYADGELPPDQALELEKHLTACTECARELALIRTMGDAMRANMTGRADRSVWERVNRRINKPIGWLLVLAGTAIWIAMAVVEWYRARELSWPYLAATAFTIGAVMIAAGYAYEQYREWKDSPYKDIEI